MSKRDKRYRTKSIPAKKIAQEIKSINDSEKVIFSFDFLDRYHELFNMGDNKSNPLSVENGWFLDLLDCLNSVSKLTRNEFKENKTYTQQEILRATSTPESRM